jgi:hypothetical protein
MLMLIWLPQNVLQCLKVPQSKEVSWFFRHLFYIFTFYLFYIFMRLNTFHACFVLWYWLSTQNGKHHEATKTLLFWNILKYSYVKLDQKQIKFRFKTYCEFLMKSIVPTWLIDFKRFICSFINVHLNIS